MEEGVKNVDGGELNELLAGFGPLFESQRALFTDALRTAPSGFKTCVAKARTGDSPAALLTTMIRSGAHLDDANLAASSGAKPAVGFEDRFQRWLAGDGLRLDEDAAWYALYEYFKLGGSDLDEALRRWRERRDSAAHAHPQDGTEAMRA
jgi:hypothetical protein